ncbi:MAG: inorganic phosphate transporter [Bacteroidia bacterium]
MSFKTVLALFICSILSFPLFAANPGIINGKISSGKTGEVVPDVSLNLAIKDSIIAGGFVTDNEGKYSIETEPGTYSLIISHPSFISDTIDIVVAEGVSVYNETLLFEDSLTRESLKIEVTEKPAGIIEHIGENYSGLTIGLFILAILAVAGFEFVNGFHDTANAVATVIYTNTLKPLHAVVWSGIWNFLGVWVGGIAVAASLMALLPLEQMMGLSVGENLAIVMAVMITAISWNLLTWYFGIPCSSSHTMIGSLLGTAMGLWLHKGGDGVNWGKAYDIGMSLLLSPAFGFAVAIVLMYLLHLFIKNKVIFEEPPRDTAPPWWIRIILVTTCTLVSFFHGSNDGQKGVGLLMIILLSLFPLHYALNPSIEPSSVASALEVIEQGLGNDTQFAPVVAIENIKTQMVQNGHMGAEQKIQLRRDIRQLQKQLKALSKDQWKKQNPEEQKTIKEAIGTVNNYTTFAPTWAILLISVSLGLGTMIGWKRIVVTIGENIGKSHLTYAQGAAAELIATATIGMSTGLGLPVSTTHVLSSGVAGTMVAEGGIGNLQRKTVTNIVLAWILTLPVTIVGSLIFYKLFQWLFL